MKLGKISVIIPRYNERVSEVRCAINRVSRYLADKKIPFEIILSQNGWSKKIIIKEKNVIVVSDPRKGLGLAIKNGLKRASGTHFYFLPTDIAFNFTDLDKMLPLSSKYDLIFGSKWHPKSVYKINPYRFFFSKLHYFLVNTFLPDFPIADPNGTYFGTLGKIKKTAQEVKSDDFFFGTELVYHAKNYRHTMQEVPVVYIKRGSSSTIRLFGDGVSFLIQLFRLAVKKRPYDQDSTSSN